MLRKCQSLDQRRVSEGRELFSMASMQDIGSALTDIATKLKPSL